MNNIQGDAHLKYSTYGNGTAIIEILNIGFEPLLTPKEYKIFKEIGWLKYRIYDIEASITLIKSKLLYLEKSEHYYTWLLENLELLSFKRDFYNDKIKYKERLFH